MPKRKFSDDDLVVRVIEAYSKGDSISSITTRLEISSFLLYKILHNNSIELRTVRPENLESLIVEAYRDRSNLVRDVIKQFNISDPTLRKILQKHGVSTRHSPQGTYLSQKDRDLQKQFGISERGYDKLVDEHHGECAICKKAETARHQSGKVKGLSVDHDHSTGEIRGLLCSRCNAAIGLLKESTEVLRNAILYLERNKAMTRDVENPYGYRSKTGRFTGDESDVAIFIPKYNTGSKRDSTGAFEPEAQQFCGFHGIKNAKITRFNNGNRRTRGRYNIASEILEHLEKEDSPTVVAFFCHGYTHGIQAGIRSPKHPRATDTDKENYEKFVGLLARNKAPTVILYACSTGDDPDGDPDTAPGSGDDSFADTLRDDLCRCGAVWCRVLSHTTAGHTTVNPFCKLMDGEGSLAGGVGGSLLADPGTKAFKTLRKLLQTDFRFRLPLLTKEAIADKIN